MAFPDDWAYSQAITIDNTKVSGSSDLTDFPVAITLDHLDVSAIDAGSASMLSVDEIRFTSDSAGATQLACQILQCTPHATASSRRFLAFVKVATLSYNTDTVVYIWYRNAAASAVAVGSTYGRNNVWSRYRAVWHLNEAAAPYIDSTGNGYDATNKLSTGIRKTTNHPIGGAYWHEFDNYTHSLEVLGSGGMLTDGDTYMMSAWHYNRWTSVSHPIIGNWNTGGPGDWRHLFTNGRARADNPPDHDQKDPTTSLSNGNVYHSAVMHTASKMQLFTNGAPNGDITPPAVTTAMGDGPNYLIGTYYNGSVRANSDIGMIRVSTEGFTAEWMETEYESIKNSGTFASVGTPVDHSETILVVADGLSATTSDNVTITVGDIDLVISDATSSHVGETFGVSLFEDSYQKCAAVLTSDPTRVDGPETKLNIELPIKGVDIPTTMKDGSSTSISYGGGNLRAYKKTPYTDANRLPLKVPKFDIINDVYTVSTVYPSFSSLSPEEIHLVRIAAHEVQPAADEPFGSDEVDNAVVYPDNADTTSTLANAANDDDFFSTSAVSCELISDQLTIAESTHGQSADNVAIELHLSIADSLHGHTTDNIVLSQSQLLEVNDTTHIHTSGEPWVKVPPNTWAIQPKSTGIWIKQ